MILILTFYFVSLPISLNRHCCCFAYFQRFSLGIIISSENKFQSGLSYIIFFLPLVHPVGPPAGDKQGLVGANIFHSSGSWKGSIRVFMNKYDVRNRILEMSCSILGKLPSVLKVRVLYFFIITRSLISSKYVCIN